MQRFDVHFFWDMRWCWLRFDGSSHSTVVIGLDLWFRWERRGGEERGGNDI
jgi:hypothetical protein